ncbi:MAG: CBS domain-containing protein, partial [Nitrospinota bacterium]
NDIVRRAVAKGMDLDSETVVKIMSPNPVKINHDESIFEARNMMKNKEVQHLIVVKEDKPVGILTSDNVMG